MQQLLLTALLLLQDPTPPVVPPPQEPVAAAPAPDPILGLIPGQPAPEFRADSWHLTNDPNKVVKKVSGSGLSGMPDLDESLAELKGDPTLAKLRGRVLLVHRTALADGIRWNRAVELVEANRDRGAALVSFVPAADAPGAVERLKNEELDGPVGILGPESKSPYARDEFALLGRSGELIALSAKFEDIEAAFAKALERPTALALERTLAAALKPALDDYWSGRFHAAREQAERLAKKHEKAATDEERQLRADAQYLATRVEALERELAAKVADARAGSSIERLVDLDLVLARGFKGASAKAAEEALKQFVAQSLTSMRMYDYRKYLELVEKRPLYFPRRDDGAGKALVKKLEGFLKTSSNDAAAQQRARSLIERYRKRHGAL